MSSKYQQMSRVGFSQTPLTGFHSNQNPLVPGFGSVGYASPFKLTGTGYTPLGRTGQYGQSRCTK